MRTISTPVLCSALAVLPLALGCAAATDAPTESSSATPSPSAPSSSVATPLASPSAERAEVHALGARGDVRTLDDPPFYMEWLSKDDQKSAKIAADAVGAVSGVYGYVSGAIDFARMVGLLDSGPSFEDTVVADLDAIRADLADIERDNRGLDFHETEHEIMNALNTLQYDALTAEHPETAVDTYVHETGLALNRLTQEDFFTRIYSDRVTDGDWKRVISTRVLPDRNGLVFDYRYALPALMNGLALRLKMLSIVTPGWPATGTQRDQMKAVRGVLVDKLTTIEGALQTTYATRVTATPTAPYVLGGGTCSWKVHHDVDGYSADPFTGTYVAVKGAFGVDDPTRYYGSRCGSANCACPTFSFDVDQDASLGGQDLRRAFTKYIAPTVSGKLQTAMDDAHQQLRIKLGLFEVRRAIDSLYALVNGDTGPIYATKLTSAYPGRCLSSAGGANAFASLATIDVCAGGAYARPEAWAFDRVTGQIRNVFSGLCLDVQNGSSRIQAPVWLWNCWPTDDARIIAQRWSYDPETHHLRNALGRTLDVTNRNSSPGTGLWLNDENGSAAQRWGL